MSDSKYQYRKLFGGGYMVHASDNQTEAFENFLLLSGQDIAEFAADAPATEPLKPSATLPAPFSGRARMKSAQS